MDLAVLSGRASSVGFWWAPAVSRILADYERMPCLEHQWQIYRWRISRRPAGVFESTLPMEIFKNCQIEAAHRLPNVPEDHKCSHPNRSLAYQAAERKRPLEGYLAPGVVQESNFRVRNQLLS